MFNRSFFITNDLNEANSFKDLSHANIKLKQHQKTLLKRCYDLENISDTLEDDYKFNTNIGIISDIPGSGKSYVMLSLIIANNKASDIEHFRHITYAKNKIYTCKKLENIYNVNIIVVPHNIYFQWQRYIEEFGNFKSIHICKMQHIDKLESQLRADAAFLKSIDIILITVGFYNNLYTLMKRNEIIINRLIIDEADNINVCLNNEIDNIFLWLITPSYRNLLHPYGSNTITTNSNGEIVNKYYSGIKKSGFIKTIFTSLLNLPNDDLRNIIAKNDDNYVRVSLDLPDIHYNIVKCKSPTYIKILEGLVSNKVMHSLNALDLKDNLSNTMRQEDIVHKFIRIYTVEIQNLRAKIEYISKLQETCEKDKLNTILKIEESITEVKNRICSIKDRINNSKQCYICYNNFESKTLLGCCLNSTCLKCIDKWHRLNNSCPICKKEITRDNLFIVKNDDETISRDYIYTKHENLDLILDDLSKIENRKIIIFSLSEQSLDNISSNLNNKYKYNYLKGNVQTINHILNDFNKDKDMRILLANPEYYGCGLNLEMTTDIIMFHKFGSDIENQVIGRAQRLGRNSNLRIWYLLHENEI